jgi:hypothetical protein
VAQLSSVYALSVLRSQLSEVSCTSAITTIIRRGLCGTLGNMLRTNGQWRLVMKPLEGIRLSTDEDYELVGQLQDLIRSHLWSYHVYRALTKEPSQDLDPWTSDTLVRWSDIYIETRARCQAVRERCHFSQVCLKYSCQRVSTPDTGHVHLPVYETSKRIASRMPRLRNCLLSRQGMRSSGLAKRRRPSPRCLSSCNGTQTR